MKGLALQVNLHPSLAAAVLARDAAQLLAKQHDFEMVMFRSGWTMKAEGWNMNPEEDPETWVWVCIPIDGQDRLREDSAAVVVSTVGSDSAGWGYLCVDRNGQELYRTNWPTTKGIAIGLAQCWVTMVAHSRQVAH